MFGNACSVDSDCRQEPNLICANNVCGCNNDSKIATLNTYGAMFNVCVHHKVILDQKTNDACAPDIFDLKATDKICSPGLFCAFCPEWAISDTYKCLSDNRARRFPRGDLYDNCTSSSDCDYDGAVCFRFDQCQLGMCVCEVGLWPSDVKRCDKPKKIGDPCDEYKDGCYDESFCKNGKCTCGDDQYPSEDKTSCRRKYGETCRADANCTDTLKCIDDKCGCETDRNISTRSYLGRLFESCTPKNITMTLKANEKCDLDLALKHCGPDLTCWRCPESGINGTPKCLSTNGPAISHADNSATTPIIQDGTEPTDTIPKVSANGPAISHADNSATTPSIQDGTEPTDTIPKVSANGPAISHADNSATTPSIQDGTEPTDTIPKVSGADQVSVIALAVGCLFVFATLVVTLY
ncbi:hypothetical protein LSAT2_007753 [Lamellibrachia satsuma]|nr:hypothetical protein LSAT2_007753 [Lamellibrachia satsuma]